MSSTIIPTGKGSIYDDDGRTRIPNDVMEELGLEKGDTLRFAAENGEIRAIKIDD